MLANVAHSPAWRSPQGYVCLACRRQRILTRRQRRFNTTSAAPSPTDYSVDSWFGGFNDLSAEYSSAPKKVVPVKVEKKKEVNVKAKEVKVKVKEKEIPKATGAESLERLRAKLTGEFDPVESFTVEEKVAGGSTSRYEPENVWATGNYLEDTSFHQEKPVERKTAVVSKDVERIVEGGSNTPGDKVDKEQLKRQLIQSLKADAGRIDGDAGKEKGGLKVTKAGWGNKATSPSQPVNVGDVQSKRGSLAANDSQVDWDAVKHSSSRALGMDQNAEDQRLAAEPSLPQSDRHIRLVECFQGNQKQTLSWGVSSIPRSRTSILDRAPPKKRVPSAAVKAAENSYRAEKYSFSREPETLETIGRDLQQISGSGQAVTETNVADQGENAPGQAREKEPEASAYTEVSPIQSGTEEGVKDLTKDEEEVQTSAPDEAPHTAVEDNAIDELRAQLQEHLPPLPRVEAAVPSLSPKDSEEGVLESVNGESKMRISYVPVKGRLIRLCTPMGDYGAPDQTEEPLVQRFPTGEYSAPDQTSKAESNETSAPEEVTSENSSAQSAEEMEDSSSTEEQTKQNEEPPPAHARLASLYENRATSSDAVNTAMPIMPVLPDLRETLPAEPEHIERGLSVPPLVRHYSTKSSPGSTKPAKSSKTSSRPTKPFSTSARARAASKPEEQPTAEEPEETPSNAEIMSMEPASIEVKPLDIPQPPVPFLEYGLDRVLFNPGVYQLQDPASRVYNFDPYLQKIMPVVEFDFDSLKEYKTSSQDQALAELAKAQKKRYIGSTSSMTSSLAHFHYLLSNWRPINLSMLTDGFVGRHTKDTFTEINKAPSAIFLRWKDGTYAIDADKEYDGANVLMLLGKSMELLLTMPTSDYERYRKSDPRKIPEAEKTAPESYKYTIMRDFLMRSQLDAYDPRLPGNGTFDLKTRAVVSVRMQAQDFEPMTGYEIYNLHGKWGSYEREYYDMMRATMLKYMLQARMGQMNGIFVAYHNVKRIFGFQYIPMHEMDRALHGQTDSCLGDQEFKASLEIMNEVFNKATEKFPGRSLRFHFETKAAVGESMPTALHVFAEPMSEEDVDKIQNSQKAKVQEFERNIMCKNDGTEKSEKEEKKAQSISTFFKERKEASDSQTPLSTKSDADTSFLSSITSSKPEENLKDLFYATVIVQSKVNGETAQDDRPKNLKRDDKWEIDYIIKDYEITSHEWALYEDCRARRKYAFTEREDEDGGDPESEGKSRQSNSFIKLLKDMAADGKAFRDRIDVMEAGKEAVRVDQPLPRQREAIDDVEDYMAWMYKK